MQAISVMADREIDSFSNVKRIIFTTTLKKNLPVEKLRDCYKGDFDKEVLLLKSNVDSLIDFHACGGFSEIPEKFKDDAFHKMVKRLDRLKTLQKRKEGLSSDDFEFVQELKVRVNEDEQTFRKHIRSVLHENFRTSLEQKRAIKKNSEFQWIGKLYPYIFIDEKKVIFMSMRKLLSGLSPLAGSGNSLLTEEFLNGSVLFIDEYDATKKDVKDEIIEEQLRERLDLIRVFRSVHSALHSERFSNDLLDVLHMDDYTLQKFYESIIIHANELYERFHLGLSYRQEDGLVDRKKNFLFYDSQFQTILEKGKYTIFAQEDKARHRMSITKGESDSSIDGNVSIQDLLRKVDAFMKRFSYFIWRWANAYMIKENSKRTERKSKDGIELDMMTVDNAAYSIIDKFLSDRQEKRIIFSYYSKMNMQAMRDGQRLPYSYFANGFTMFELEDNDANNDDTMMSMVKIKDTPESIMAFIAENALVFAISATAAIPSATGNYCRDYLKDVLKDDFHSLPDEDAELADYIRKELEMRNEPYRNEIDIEVNDVPEDDELIKERLINCFTDKESAQLCLNKIELEASELGEEKCSYYANKYMRLACVVRLFANLKGQQTLLYLGKALPKESDGSTLKKNVLDYIIEMVNKDVGLKEPHMIKSATLTSSNFDETKKQICERLKKGEKLIIFSSYQTVGAGQNLQYPVNESYRDNIVTLPHSYDYENEERDIDSIYLDDITYLTENINDVKHFDLKRNMYHLMQVMECFGNYEISVETKRELIKAGFNSLQNIHPKCNVSLNDAQSIKLHVTRDVIQAVGRMGRTCLRNKHISIYIYEKVLRQLDYNTLMAEFNSEEVKAIGKKLKTKEVTLSVDNQLQLALLRANTISIQVSGKILSTVKRSFKGEWSENDMRLWKELRELVLKHPTANEEDLSDGDLRAYYINGLKPLSKYLFSVNNNSYRNIHVWFEDEDSFRKSKQIIKDDNGRLVVHKCSEDDARLQILLNIKGIREMFQKRGYAEHFQTKKYIMSPALYTNIYKGALGEVCGRYIIENSTSLRLEEIQNGNQFEYFDYRIEGYPNVYIDFKHWKISSAPYNDKDAIMREIRRKMDKIGAQRVYIIGILKDSESIANVSADERIITIPYLVDENVKIAHDMLKCIKEV
ncbi:MAG: hypothetical protein IKH63_10840 [Prevotella sp.]|nr:hypothetical protein [Prevotella sp.]